MDMIYHETHKPEEEEEEDPLDNEDLLELLTIVSNEAFSSTDVFKVRFEQISKSNFKFNFSKSSTATSKKAKNKSWRSSPSLKRVTSLPESGSKITSQVLKKTLWSTTSTTQSSLGPRLGLQKLLFGMLSSSLDRFLIPSAILPGSKRSFNSRID